MKTSEFNNWLSGFIDAEGNFQVYFDRHYLRVAFRITLHQDDVAVLHRIKNHLKIGNVEIHANSCVYVIRDVKLILKTLIPILDANPLRTVKYLDYLDFKKIILFLNEAKTTVIIDEDIVIYKSIIQGMNKGRLTYNKSLIPVHPLNKYWLLGFTEGEGTFGIKNLVPYFQLGQHERSLHVMEDIRLYLSSIDQIFKLTINSPALIPSRVTHQKTKVIVYSYNNVDSLHDTLAYLFLDLPFQTRKKTDFLY